VWFFAVVGLTYPDMGCAFSAEEAAPPGLGFIWLEVLQ
jgi:hypothetical protein